MAQYLIRMTKRSPPYPRLVALFPFPRRFTSSLRRSSSMRVALLGAASKTGSCLSLFLKQSSLIDELAIYDNASTQGITYELSGIDTRCKVESCRAGEECLRRTLEDAKIVMIVSDRFLGRETSERKILEANANTLSDLLPSVIRYSPEAMLALVMSPVNSLVPLALEIYKAAGVLAYTRIFGVTTLDTVRANTFAAQTALVEPECMMVPVIGGSSRHTTVPLFSHATPCRNLSQYLLLGKLLLSMLEQKDVIILTYKVRAADRTLLQVDDALGTSYITRAFAAARFCVSLCKGLKQETGIVECAYVRSCVMPQVTYFASPLQLGPAGIQKYLGIPALSNYECQLLQGALPLLREAIATGEALALGEGVASSEICPVA